MATKKYFHIELYGPDDMLLKEWKFQTKQEQLKKYYELLGEGHPKSQIIKITREWFE